MEENKQINQASGGRTGGNQVKTSAEIIKDIDTLARRMGIWSQGVDYLIETGASQPAIEAYLEILDTLAVKVVGREQNLSKEEMESLLDRESRTEEQKKAIQDANLRLYETRIDRYIGSKYLASIGVIVDTAEEELNTEINPGDPESEPIVGALNMLNRYFYTQRHKELNPLTQEPLSEAETEELRKLTKDYITFHQTQSKPPVESLIDFIAPAMGNITELAAQSDTLFLPIAKIFREQQDIGMRGSEGALVNVGKNTNAGAVNVTAYISDINGNPLNIDAVMQRVESAIGQLIDENGRSLPIIVTPQQIYRAYARLSNDAIVTKQQAAEMERAMDALMFSPSRLDFKAQLEKHKNIKHQPDYDYKDENAGRLKANLIPAEKGEAINRLGERQVSYMIYNYPVLYRYSHIVGQIAQVPNKLLTGGEKSAIKDKKTAEAQRNALNIGMRTIVLSRITFWKSRIEKHESVTSALKIHEIAKACNLELTEKIERTLRRNIRQYLDELQAQGTKNGGIKNYQVQKDGRRVVGFYVYF